MTPQVAAISSETPSPKDHQLPPLQVLEGNLPESLRTLLDSPHPADLAWDVFIAEYSHLLLHVVKSVPGTRDDRMDTYARILEALRADDCRRLRSYRATPNTKFTTWLVVVAKRVCIDHHRLKFGRTQPVAAVRAVIDRKARRDLEQLVASAGDIADVAAGDARDPDRTIREHELARAVSAALNELSAPDRLLLALRFRDGLSTPEIARVMRGRSALSVYRRIGKVLETLRHSLHSRGIDDPVP